MKLKYLLILTTFLVIAGVILQITHFWYGLGIILLLSGLLMGAILTILSFWDKKEQQKSFSMTEKILMFVGASMVIIGAILKITHIWDDWNNIIYLVGFVFYPLSYLCGNFISNSSQK